MGPFEKNHFRMNWLEAGWFRQDPSWGEWQSDQDKIGWGKGVAVALAGAESRLWRKVGLFC